jgi:subtilisin family serine protease
MDTGVRSDHVEFEDENGASRVIAGIDVSAVVGVGASSCASSSKSLFPCYSSSQELSSSSHGTGVASVVAGRRVGVAPEAMIVSVRIMNERGLTTTAAYMHALDGIIRHAWSDTAPPFRTAVVNISGWTLERLGYSSPSGVSSVRYSNVERKMREMIGGVGADGKPDPGGKRFLFVVAANNLDGGCGSDGVVDRFPATAGPEIDGIITVGGMTASNSWWSGGCRGAVEVLAPAQGVFSATITGRDHYRGRRPNHRSGTSFAAPIVSGIAARLLAQRPDLSPQQLENWIKSTPSRIGSSGREYGGGRVAFLPSLSATAVAASHAER